jgi:hypothetical protein
MKELNLPVAYRPGKDLDVIVAQNYAYFSKMLKDMGVIK